MGEREITEFLTHLAVEKSVAASTQNQAFSALLFLYQQVLERKLDFIDSVQRVSRPAKIPVVFTRAEAHAVLKRLHGENQLMAELLYGAGLRLMECVRLRVKDIDFGYNQITVRDGKGLRQRVTLLPQRLRRPLQLHLAHVRALHQRDLANGGGKVHLPFALQRKYPNANKSWPWQYVFPAAKLSVDPRLGEMRRHHISKSIFKTRLSERSTTRVCPKRPVAIHSGTVSRLICSKMDRIFVPFRSCSGTATFPRP